MLGQVVEGVDILVGRIVLAVAQGQVVFSRQRLDAPKESVGERDHVGIRDGDIGRGGADGFLAVRLGDSDGVLDGADAAVDEDVLGLVVRQDSREFPNVGEAVDLAVADPAPEVMEVETGSEDGVLDVCLLELDEAAEPVDLERIVVVDVAIESVHIVERVDLLRDGVLVASAAGDHLIVVHELDIAQVVEVTGLFVGGPLTRAHKVSGHPDRLDVDWVWVVQYQTWDFGPVSVGVLVGKFAVDCQAGVAVDADEAVAVGPDDDGD